MIGKAARCVALSAVLSADSFSFICCVLFSLIKKENILGNGKNLGILSGLKFDLCKPVSVFTQSLLLDKDADQLCGIMRNLTCFCIIN